MMKITLFVFAVLLVAVVFAAPKPEGEEKPTGLELDLLKEGDKLFKTVMSQENMEKFKDTFKDTFENFQKSLEKAQEQLQGFVKEVTKNTQNTENSN